MRAIKRIIYMILGVGILLFLYRPINVIAADLSFQNNIISNVGNNDARISAQIINSSKKNVTETGFYLGTSSGALSKCSNKDTGSWKYSKISVGFTMSQYWGTLSENTTYYYRFYAIADGTEYTSGEYSFKTSGGNAEKAGLSFYENNVTDVTENNGRINAKISNPDGRCVTETGFYIGTSPEISKNGINDPCSLTNQTITVGYTMSKYYGTLQPGTTYYYKFYAIGDGQEYCSETYSFTTVSVPQAAPEPIPEATPQPEPTPSPTPDRKPASQESQGSNEIAKRELSFYEYGSKDITENNGRISAKISNPDGRKVTETGFYIGTTEQLYKNVKHDDCELSDKTITVGYTMSAYYGVLEPGTTYYCRFYAIGDGEEFISDVYSFTTKAVQQSTDSTVEQGEDNNAKESKISFSVKKVESITHENARIKAEVKNPNKEKITETGFYYGSDKSNMIKSIESDKGNWETGITVSYDIGQYARVCLMSETKYYYQFYVIVNGKEVVSEINTFITAKENKEESKNNNSVIEEVPDLNVSSEDTEEIVQDTMIWEEDSSIGNKKTYTISLNANGGQVNPQSIEVANGECYGSLPIPVKEGYIFEGWYKNYFLWKEYVTEATIYKRGLGIIDTLNAKWREKSSFYIKFDANGGSVDETMRLVYEQDVLGSLPVPVREGYDFVGWYTESVGGTQVNANKVILGNEICYAQWKESKLYGHIYYEDTKEYLINQQVRYDCAIASMATVESWHKKTKDNIYKTIYKKVGGPSDSMDWKKAGYVRYNTSSMEKLYEELKKGPCIVGRDGHYSVVIGYIGNEDVLELSGFRVMEVGFGYDKDDIFGLDDWLAKAGNSQIKQIAVRNKGI